MVHLDWNIELDYDSNFNEIPPKVVAQNPRRFANWQTAERFVFTANKVYVIASARIYRREKGRDIPLKAYVRDNGEIKAVPLV